MKPHPEMLAAVLAVAPGKRKAAALHAEKVYFDRLATFNAWNDFTTAAHITMAAMAAAAEVAFLFGNKF